MPEFKKHNRLSFLSSVDQTAQFLKENGYIDNEIEYYDSGHYGMVFTTSDPTKVLKITSSNQEINNARDMVGYKFDNVNYISKVLPKETDVDVAIIVIEKLEPLPSKVKEPFENKIEPHITSSVMSFVNKKISKKEIDTFVNDIKTESMILDIDLKNNIINWVKDMNRYYFRFVYKLSYISKNFAPNALKSLYTLHTIDPQFIPDVVNGIVELDSINIFISDLHSENILFDNKSRKYKLIDIQ